MNTILRLFYDLAVYREIIHQPFKKTLLRFLLAYLFLSAGYSFYFNHKFMPEIIQTVTTVITDISQNLPNQATFSIDNYLLSTTNLPQPFIIKDYLYLDTTTNLPISTVSAMITLSSTQVRFLSQNSTYQANTYKELELNDLHITGEQINLELTTLSQNINQYKSYLPLILTFPIFISLIVGRLFQTIFYSLLFLLAISLTKGNYRFKELLKLTMNTVIIAETLNLAVMIVYGASFPIVFTLAFAGVSILAYLNLPVRVLKL